MEKDENFNQKKKRINLTIREMQIDDIAKVFHLGEKLFTAQKVPNLYRTWDEYEVVSLFQTDPEFCLVAEADDMIVGFALGLTINKSGSAWKYGHLHWLGVEREYQRQGIAKNFLRILWILWSKAAFVCYKWTLKQTICRRFIFFEMWDSEVHSSTYI